jgi:hypothetical protein
MHAVPPLREAWKPNRRTQVAVPGILVRWRRYVAATFQPAITSRGSTREALRQLRPTFLYMRFSANDAKLAATKAALQAARTGRLTTKPSSTTWGQKWAI